MINLIKICINFFNNCIYGKSIENAGKKINVKMINNKKKYLKIANKPNFISQKIIDKNFVAVHVVVVVVKKYLL